jgi:hypothetical protein
VVAGWFALACALSVPLQLLEHGGVAMPYGWVLTLSGLILVGAAVVALRGTSRALGAGLVFGATLAVVPTFIESSMDSDLGGAYVAVSVLTTILAVIAAISAIVYFAREIGGRNLRAPLALAYALSALGFIVAFNPGDVQFRNGSDWVTFPGLVGSGVSGKFLFAGVVAIIALVIAALTAGMLSPATGARGGLIAGFLAANGAALIGASLEATESFLRPAPALYVVWVVWLIALALGIALLARNRSRPVVSAPPTLVR